MLVHEIQKIANILELFACVSPYNIFLLILFYRSLFQFSMKIKMHNVSGDNFVIPSVFVGFKATISINKLVLDYFHYMAKVVETNFKPRSFYRH